MKYTITYARNQESHNLNLKNQTHVIIEMNQMPELSEDFKRAIKNVSTINYKFSQKIKKKIANLSKEIEIMKRNQVEMMELLKKKIKI